MEALTSTFISYSKICSTWHIFSRAKTAQNLYLKNLKEYNIIEHSSRGSYLSENTTAHPTDLLLDYLGLATSNFFHSFGKAMRTLVHASSRAFPFLLPVMMQLDVKNLSSVELFTEITIAT